MVFRINLKVGHAKPEIRSLAMASYSASSKQFAGMGGQPS